MSLKLLVVSTYASDRQYSLTGFSSALSLGLPAYGIETRLLTPPAILGQRIFGRGKLSKWVGHFDKLILFPAILKRAAQWADVVHFVDHGLAIYTKYLQDKPHMVTCNDLIAMRAARGELSEWSGREYPLPSARFQQLIARGLERAHFVVCISQATQSDLHRLTAVAPENSRVIYDALFHDFTLLSAQSVQAQLDHLSLPRDVPYLLHIGRSVPTKNRHGALEIFRQLRQNHGFSDWHLVMSGGELSSQLRQDIIGQNLESVVHECSDLTAEQIRALYMGAKALLFPSFYEGFGLPIIEAQACHCPVLTSNRAPMTEVGGAGAFYFDPARPAEAARNIAPILRSPEELEQMKLKGVENVQRFEPQIMLQAYSEAYHAVYQQHAGATASPCSARAMRGDTN